MKIPKQRNAAWFVREVRRQVKEKPTQPVRFDIMLNELKTVQDAWVTLNKDCDCRGGIPWGCMTARHIDPTKPREAYRAAFFGPGYLPKAAPVKTVPIKPIGKDQHAFRRGRDKLLNALQREYGSEYHIEYAFSAVKGKRVCDCHIMRVWRGEDWLAREHAGFYPAEIARFLSANVTMVTWLKPIAEKIFTRDRRLASQSSGAANQKRCIAPALGNTPARYTHTDAEILKEVTEYKRQHPQSHTLATMLNHIRIKHEGRPYLNYSDPEKLRRRLKKIFAPKTPRQGYDALK